MSEHFEQPDEEFVFDGDDAGVETGDMNTGWDDLEEDGDAGLDPQSEGGEEPEEDYAQETLQAPLTLRGDEDIHSKIIIIDSQKPEPTLPNDLVIGSFGESPVGMQEATPRPEQTPGEQHSGGLLESLRRLRGIGLPPDSAFEHLNNLERDHRDMHETAPVEPPEETPSTPETED